MAQAPEITVRPSTELVPELKTHQMCACFNLRRAARAVTQFFDNKLAPSGIRATQLGVLATLHYCGPSRVSDLADNLGMDRTTLTRNLRPLERRGFISLDPGSDRRTRTIALTSVGAKALSDAYPLWCEAQGEIAGRIGLEGWKEITAALDRIVALTQSADSGR